VGSDNYRLEGEADEDATIYIEPDFNLEEIAIVCYYRNNEGHVGFTISKLDTKTCISGDTPSTSDYYDISLFM
jgi:hypothetical protein